MTVLCYHTVDDDWASPLAVRTGEFEQQMAWVARSRRVLDLPEALPHLEDRQRLPRGSALLTFDDGFSGVHEHAFPVLRRLGLPATVFVVTRTLDDRTTPVDWVRESHLPEGLRCLEPDEIHAMRDSGIRFGSHSVTHRDLPELTFAEQLQEMRESREALEDLLHERIDAFAYPRGLHSRATRDAARQAGYRVALTLPECREPRGPHAAPRVGIYRDNTLAATRIKTHPAYLPVRTRLSRRPTAGERLPRLLGLNR
jgi:peptidoglycan/xylan/chitin deacetylase (PgdA/CDA1 family)